MKLNTTIYLLIVGFVFSVAIFIGSIFYAYRTEEAISNKFEDVESTHQRINRLKRLGNLLDNMETSYKSYGLSNEKEFLEMFKEDQSFLFKEIDHIKSEFVNVNCDTLPLFELKKLIQKRIKLGLYVVHTDKNIPTDSVQKEVELRLEAYGLLGKILNEQEKILDIQNKSVVKEIRQTHFVVGLVGITAFALTVLILAFFWQYNKIHTKVEADLIELNENKNKFFSIISHDLRGPVKNIALMAQMLRNNNQTSVDPEKITKLIETSANNLSSLLDNLLKWSRLQMKKIEFEPENVDLHLITEDVCNNLAVHASQKSITITNYIPTGQKVYADQNMVATILRNLVSNSIKFTPKGGSIHIEAELKSYMVQVTVQDSGVGMPPAIAEKIFSIDFKHTTKGTNKEEGTGLGLKICKEFVVKNGGDIKIETDQGIGSKFIFTLPYVKL